MYKKIWDPFVGNKFYSSDERIFLIGESHYSVDVNKNFDENCYNEFINNKLTTVNIVNRYLSGENWKFFENTNRLLNKDEDRKELFNRVSFYNLIQEPMKTLNQRPTNIQFEKYQLAFLNYLIDSELNPKTIIFLGNSSEKYFHKNAKLVGLEILKNEVSKIGRFRGVYKTVKSNTNEYKIIFIKHPSSYFSVNKWKEYLYQLNFR